MAIRKNATTLTSAEKTEFVNAVKAVKASGKYDQQVLRHAQAQMSAIHRCPAFLPWHRSFILDYEKDLQQASGNPNLGLPYWNWAEDASAMWADDFLGGNGDQSDSGIVKTGPFRQGEWTIVNSSGNSAGPLIREFGEGTPSLPTPTDIDNVLNTRPYDASPWNLTSQPSFRNRVEGWYGASGPGMHNRGHVWVGGSMTPMTSPNDPVFFLHHCFVDKLWHDWQVQNPGEGYLPISGGSPRQNLNDQMEPTVSGSTTPATMLDIQALGYSYDTDAGTDPGDTGPGDTGPGDTGPGDTGPGDTGPGDTGPGDTGTGGRGCFIATAAYGSEMASPVQTLRDFRDNIALNSRFRGLFKRVFDFYYRLSPPVANAMRQNKALKNIIKYALIWPLLGIVKVGSLAKEHLKK